MAIYKTAELRTETLAFRNKRGLLAAAAAPDRVSHDLPSHPAADIFPLDLDSIDALAESIRSQGQLEAITVSCGKVLDGRRRQIACRRVGVAPKYVEYTGASAFDFVLAKNLNHRRLSTSQAALVAGRIATFRVGSNQHEQGLSNGRAAKLLGVSERAVSRARRVLDANDDALICDVELGKVSLAAACKLLDVRAGKASPRSADTCAPAGEPLHSPPEHPPAFVPPLLEKKVSVPPAAFRQQESTDDLDIPPFLDRRPLSEMHSRSLNELATKLENASELKRCLIFADELVFVRFVDMVKQLRSVAGRQTSDAG